MKRRSVKTVGRLVLVSIILVGLIGGGIELWSSSGRPVTQSGGSLASAQAAVTSEPDALQSAFTRIAEQVGPAVVSISTEQVERMRQQRRVHPFLGDDQFEEFFRQFYGDVPEREFRRFGLGSGVIIDERGLILTNEHVIADVEKITVTLADGRELEGTLIRVTAFASLNKTGVDLALVQTVLKDLITLDEDNVIAPVDIINHTAEYFKLTVDDLYGSSRSQAVATARQIAMYLCREMTNLSLPKIGQLFGNRDHTTVMYANKKITELMKERRSIYNQVTELTSRIKQNHRYKG